MTQLSSIFDLDNDSNDEFNDQLESDIYDKLSLSSNPIEYLANCLQKAHRELCQNCFALAIKICEEHSQKMIQVLSVYPDAFPQFQINKFPDQLTALILQEDGPSSSSSLLGRLLNSILSNAECFDFFSPIMHKTFQKMLTVFKDTEYGTLTLTNLINSVNAVLICGEHQDMTSNVLADHLLDTINYKNTIKIPSQPVELLIHIPANFVEEILTKCPLVFLKDLRVFTRSRTDPERDILDYIQQNHGWFGSISTRGAMERERSMIQQYHESFNISLYTLLSTLIQRKSSREDMLQWISAELRFFALASKPFTHQQECYNFQAAYPDAIFWNLSYVLLKLSLPFCNDKFIPKISDFYHFAEREGGHEDKNVHSRMFFENEDILGSLNRDVNQTENFRTQLSSLEPFNFITQCFFLTQRCLKLSLVGLATKRKQALKKLHEHSDRSTPEEPEDRAQLNKKENVLYTHMLSIDVMIYNKEMANMISVFSAASLKYITRGSVSTRPPIPAFLLDNMTDYFLLLKRGDPKKLEFDETLTFVDAHGRELTNRSFSGAKVSQDLLLGACRVMKYESNPIHVRAEMAEAIIALLPLVEEFQEDSPLFAPLHAREFAFREFSSDKTRVNELVRSIMQVFADCRRAGAWEVTHGGDHEVAIKRRPLYKMFTFFNTQRSCINEIINIAKETDQDVTGTELPVFLHFLQGLIYDSNNFLSESLTKITEIRKKELNPVDTSDMTEEDRKEHVTEQERLEQSCRYYCAYSKLCLDLMLKLSREPEVVKVFLKSKQDRAGIALMLNLYINKLADPRKRRELMVIDKRKFGFEPRVLICHICQILLNLIVKNADEENIELFVKQIVEDTQNFNVELYYEAKKLYTWMSNMPDMMKFSFNVSGFESVVHQVKEMWTLMSEAGVTELDFDDAPDEYMDPITCDIMEDPVKLLTSNNIVDRSTAQKQLLTDQRDPFNRKPLTLAMIEDQPELKQQIEEYVNSMKQSQVSTETSK